MVPNGDHLRNLLQMISRTQPDLGFGARVANGAVEGGDFRVDPRCPDPRTGRGEATPAISLTTDT